MHPNPPESRIRPGHPSYERLAQLAGDLIARAGGEGKFRQGLAVKLREEIDAVIMTPRTRRTSFSDLEKTEKTYIGTRIEIMIRAWLRLQKGKLDIIICGQDADIKHTMGNNWMIPPEAAGHPCLLVAADEERQLCWCGLILAAEDNLTAGKNRDGKRSVSAAGKSQILWLARELPYPANEWNVLPAGAIDRIFGQPTGNAAVIQLFIEMEGRPVSRQMVESAAPQKDFMRRLRSDAGGGSRDELERQGLLLLNGKTDRQLLALFGFNNLSSDCFVSVRPRTDEQRAAARQAGWAPL